MLRVVTGSFHPHLESSLVDHILRAKAAEPFAPLAVLLPSSSLLDRVRCLLVRDRQLCLLNVHLLTFHQLVLRLDAERRLRSPHQPFRVVDTLFFERLVRHLVRSRLSGLTPLQRIGHSSGTWQALWATVRDLKDAGVEPAEALRGIEEGYFDEEDRDWLRALFSLHAAVREVGATLRVGTPDDLAASLLADVPDSPFLASLRQVFYYGFYDLTQIQLSLFEAVSAAAPTTVFFPLDEDPASSFARRFYERHIHAHAPSSESSPPPSGLPSPVPIQVTVRTVIGAEEELSATCRTILELVETNGYRFDEIGVIARTLEPYRLDIERVFTRHRVPLAAAVERPLLHEPLAKTLIQLVSLPLTDCYRTTVLDVVTSPLYAIDHRDTLATGYRPEQWRLIVDGLRITKGLDEWARLEQAAHAVMVWDESEQQEWSTGRLTIAPEVIESLWRVVSGLLADVTALPRRGTVSQLVDAGRRLVAAHLVSAEAIAESGDDGLSERIQSIWEAIERLWAGLGELEMLGEELDWAEFVEVLTQAMERATVAIGPTDTGGVTVVDAMAARGLSFKAVFVLGLNEKVFPRYIREDAFLRDRHRRVLDATLGFKIDEKLTGYDEEALLFHLIRQSAGARFVLSYQRGDDAGRVLAPSPFLDSDGVAQAGIAESVPRRLTERLTQRPTLQAVLPPGDLAQCLAINGRDPSALLRVVGQDAETFRHAAGALQVVETDATALNAHDGVTGHLDTHWARLRERGLAPTPLERYARCPFQYFSADVLRLETVRLAPSQEPDAAVLGTVCHAALRRCYEALLPTGWPAEPVTDDTVEWCIRSAVDEAAREIEAQYRTGHYLLWELSKERLITLVSAAVQEEQTAFLADPFIPIAFEREAEGGLRDEAYPALSGMNIRGRLDRLDRHRDSGAIRIVDYKYKTGSEMKPEDRNLLQAALRGYRLQPPLYARLTFPELGDPAQVQFILLGPRWESPVVRSTFETSSWSGETGRRLAQSLAWWVGGIEAGRFQIQPDTYCEQCEFRVICRREHQPSWWRAHRSE
ncbi:MAG: PD-(D/E)XK nuclease family protein, partial [Nitrospira sp.]